MRASNLSLHGHRASSCVFEGTSEHISNVELRNEVHDVSLVGHLNHGLLDRHIEGHVDGLASSLRGFHHLGEIVEVARTESVSHTTHHLIAHHAGPQGGPSLK